MRGEENRRKSKSRRSKDGEGRIKKARNMSKGEPEKMKIG